jgi:hypothetical protein
MFDYTLKVYLLCGNTEVPPACADIFYTDAGGAWIVNRPPIACDTWWPAASPTAQRRKIISAANHNTNFRNVLKFDNVMPQGHVIAKNICATTGVYWMPLSSYYGVSSYSGIGDSPAFASTRLWNMSANSVCSANYSWGIDLGSQSAYAFPLLVQLQSGASNNVDLYFTAYITATSAISSFSGNVAVEHGKNVMGSCATSATRYSFLEGTLSLSCYSATNINSSWNKLTLDLGSASYPRVEKIYISLYNNNDGEAVVIGIASQNRFVLNSVGYPYMLLASAAVSLGDGVKYGPFGGFIG